MDNFKKKEKRFSFEEFDVLFSPENEMDHSFIELSDKCHGFCIAMVIYDDGTSSYHVSNIIKKDIILRAIYVLNKVM